MAAYQDAMEKLLWPERRPGIETIRRTTQASTFKYEEGRTVCIAHDTPIDLIANVDVVTPENFRKDNFWDGAFSATLLEQERSTHSSYLWTMHPILFRTVATSTAQN